MQSGLILDYRRSYWATVLTLENNQVTWLCWVVWGLN